MANRVFIKTSIIVALFAVTFALVGCDQKADLYVAPDGNDAWSGKLSAPNAAKTDGPLASLARARDVVREIRRSGNVTKPITVDIRGGFYTLAEPFKLSPEDSGAKDVPVIYTAHRDETPVFSGGKRITGWKKGNGSLWQAEIPEVKAGKWYFHQLFVNGERRTRARMPNEGYLRTVGPLEKYGKDRKDPSFSKNEAIRKGFKFREGDLKSSWRNLGDANVFLYHSWTTSMHWFDRIDEGQGAAHFVNRSGWPIAYWEADQRYHVENIREALDSPGEWYLDRTTGLLEYSPLPGEDLNKLEVVAPVLSQLLLVEGDWANGKFVRDVILHGLSFRHADWDFADKTKTVDGQSFVFLPGAVHVRGAERVVLDSCEIANAGTYAIALEDGCKSNIIRKCHIHDLGGGGIRIGEFVRQKTAAKTSNTTGMAVPELSLDGTGTRDTGHNVVDNCFIHDGGHVFAAGVGVIIGHSAYNEITHNEICDFYYSSVSVGWVWGFGASAAHHNLVAYNHLHHIGWGMLSDMGGVYTLGPSPGTVVAHNYIHHVNSYSYGGWGLYTDEGSSEIVLEDNIVHDTKDGCFHQHYGRANILRNNILAFSRETQIRRSREDVTNSMIVVRNIVYCDNDNMLSRVWKNGDYLVNSNLYWTTCKSEPFFDGRDWEEWRATSGQDKDSLIADPLFADPVKRDFRLKSGSPAGKIGFRPIELSGIGLYGDSVWVALPGKVKRPEFNLPLTAKPKLTSFAEDFETTPKREKTANADTLGENVDATIRVVDDVAASGKHSLRFVDAPGLSAAHNPMLQYKPRLIKGVACVSFDIRPGPGAILSHEWRDAANPYKTGPSLCVEANGDVKADGKKLTSVPQEKWSHIEISCGLGEQSSCSWDLAVTPAGGEPQKFEKLAVRSRDFKRLQWLGFVSGATNTVTFHLDNIKLGVVAEEK
ncbi:MAG: hypothetical protein A2283_18365 [Lentisphaerae bacterium RIFOXYA12_FULL_48_11]|nr:MAG: hypothetical protein A2283_18365 [Lentisphaerae bacterium RIFOXYA12_FULL_48_11]